MKIIKKYKTIIDLIADNEEELNINYNRSSAYADAEKFYSDSEYCLKTSEGFLKSARCNGALILTPYNPFTITCHGGPLNLVEILENEIKCILPDMQRNDRPLLEKICRAGAKENKIFAIM